MTKRKRKSEEESIEQPMESKREHRIKLRLFVAGSTPLSARAIVNVRKLCDDHLQGRYSLEIADISLDPAAAQKAQIIATPTLLKEHPLPVRRFIGDLSNIDRILAELGVGR